MPIGMCRMVVYEATEHYAKMGNSYRHVTCIFHLGPLESDVQHDEIRQYAPNQALGHLEGIHMGHHEAWVRQYGPFYVPSNEHEKTKIYLKDHGDLGIV